MFKARLLLLTLLLTGCASGSLVKQFEAVAFDQGRLMRWEEPPRLGIYADPDQQEDFLAVRNFLTKAGPGIDPGPGPHNLIVGYAREDEYESLTRLMPHDATDVSHVNDLECWARAFRTKGEPVIVFAVAVINIDGTRAERRACLHHEVLHALGLFGHGCHYRPSVMCLADFPQTITDADRRLLRALYDPRLKPGMSREQAMPIVRQIIKEQETHGG